MRHATASCVEVPQFDRLSYFYGQMLHASDLQAEQSYFREKLKLHNRCLHGWGVVCGLLVTPPPPDPDCPPATDVEIARIKAEIERVQSAIDKETDSAGKQKLLVKREELQRRLETAGKPSTCAPTDTPTKVRIDCGLAIDCEGNELVVRQPLTVDLWSRLTGEERQRIEPTKPTTLYVGVCYRECPIDPVRPVVPDVCGVTSECNFGRLRDSITVVVTLDGERWKDDRCEPCCTGCTECCVLLARIDEFERGTPLGPEQVHAETRRQLSLRPTTRITGINWVHGGTYTPEMAAQLLGTGSHDRDGLQIRFSRPIRTETIMRGTVDTWVIEGGRGRAAGISNKEGALLLPSSKTTETITYQDKTKESLNEGDRVLITVRSAFLLDDCCRPVDGAHIGGRVPLLEHALEPSHRPDLATCLTPPGVPGPWTSGDGGAANFESWIWIGSSEHRRVS